MLRKLLWDKAGRGKLLWAVAGSLIGFLLLLGAFQFYIDYKSIVNKNKDLINPEFIIINKRVSVLQTLSNTITNFSDEEIKNLEAQNFVKEVTPFVANNFKVSAYTNKGGNIPYFYTELFFEAIPDKYLDIANDQWEWDTEKQLIPVIIPKDYLNLYNFGFAQSQGLPQISANLISFMKFNVRIRGENKTEEFKAKILGFSNRINSILVPYDFIIWANEKYGSTPKQPSRLLVSAPDPSDPELYRFFEKNEYETNKEKLRNSKLNVLLKAMLGVVSFISAIIILLAFMVFVLGFELIISRADQKIKTLIHLGYLPKTISMFYIRNFIVIVSAINIISLAAVWFLQSLAGKYFTERGFELGSGLSYITVLTAIGISIVLVISNSFVISKQIQKLGLS